MNEQQRILVQRLKEGELSLNRFLKVGDGKLHPTPKNREGEYLDKAAFETDFQNHLYGPEDLDSFPRWGICGRDFLVLLDFDKKEIYDIMKERLPPTFEVTSPRHGLPHRYYIVCGKQVENLKFHIKGDIDSEGHKNPCGEIRADNHYLVAPGTVIRYQDLKTGEWKTGEYTITNNVPIKSLEYDEFMDAVKPYLLDRVGERILTDEKLEKGVSIGERHDTIFRYACRLVGDNPEGRFPASVALDILRRYNQTKLADPVEDEFLTRVILEGCDYAAKESGFTTEQIAELGFEKLHEQNSKTPKPKDKEKPKSQADQLLTLCLSQDAEFFHDQHQTPYVRVRSDTCDTCDSVSETLSGIDPPNVIIPIRSRQFKAWLANLMWQKKKKAPGSEGLNSAINVLHGKALSEGKQHTLYNRVAPDPEGHGFWIDMTDQKWRAIHVSAEGWKIVENPPILFRRYSHQLP